jgi:threonine/homoserine/homoserine lactone efflux protein
MLSIALIFLLTAAVSFAGSLQVGPVNYFVVETCLRQNRTSGVLVAVGGSIPECIYSLLAIVVGAWLQKVPGLFLAFQWTTVALLTVLAVVQLRRKNTMTVIDNASHRGSLLKGFALGMLNPQLLPFWLVVYTSLFAPVGLRIDNAWEQAAFVLGTGIGAFALHLLLIFVVKKNRERLTRWINYPSFNYLLSALFFVLALIQLISLC